MIVHGECMPMKSVATTELHSGESCDQASRAGLGSRIKGVPYDC